MRAVILCCLIALLPLSVFAQSPRILFDQGHRQAFVVEKEGPLQLSGFAKLLQRQSWKIDHNTATLTKESLKQTDALVISGPFAPLDEAETQTVLDYLKTGGKVAIMIHIWQPVLPLLNELGVDVGNRAINEMQEQPNGKTTNFVVTNFQPHPLTEGLHHFSIYGGWPLKVFAQQGKGIARSSKNSWVDINNDQRLSKGDLVSPFDVVISGDYGRGSFVVFADDAIFQNQFLHGGNKRLAENLSNWLKKQALNTVEI